MSVELELDRALADALGGSSGGWAFWLASLAAIEYAIGRSRDREQAFCSHPPGEWGRFAYDLEDAVQLAATGVDVQLLVNAEPDGKGGRRRESIAEILMDRAGRVAAANGERYGAGA